MILAIEITRISNELKLSQEHYVKKIFRKFEHLDCKLVSNPYDNIVLLTINLCCK